MDQVGSNSICCARTAALQGGTKCRCQDNAGFHAAIRAASSATIAKTATKAPQHPARGHERSSKIKAGGNHESPDATKSVQEARKMRPRDAQEHPKAAQELSKCGPRAPKTCPRQTWEAPRPFQKRVRQAPRRRWATIVVGSLLHKGVGTIFRDFCVARVACEVCSDPLKLWFCYIQSTPTTQARVHSKTLKNKTLEAPKPSPEPFETSKIEVGAPQNASKKPTSDEKAPKMSKKWPQTRPRAKNEPT